jgi:hypothetical protein
MLVVAQVAASATGAQKYSLLNSSLCVLVTFVFVAIVVLVSVVALNWSSKPRPNDRDASSHRRTAE